MERYIVPFTTRIEGFFYSDDPFSLSKKDEKLIPATNKKICKSGSMTPTSQGEVNPIACKDINLALTVALLQEEIREESQKLHWDERGHAKIAEASRMLSELNHIKITPFIFTVDYQENISATEALPEGPLVKRFGMNPEAVSKAATDKKYSIPPSKLHFVEQEVLKLALQELDNPSLTEASKEFAHNVVVVDIFARKGGSLKVDAKTNLPETHAIVLWKKSEDEIVLIDPSKREFSEHIVESLNLLLSGTATVSAADIKGEVIYSVKQGEPEYHDPCLPNPKTRDCIDIAVKIGFEISEQQKASTSATSDILARVFERITNRQALNTSLPIDSIAVREAQSTKKADRDKFYQFLKNNQDTLAAALKNAGLKNPSYAEMQEVLKPQFHSTLQLLKNAGLKELSVAQVKELFNPRLKEILLLLKNAGLKNLSFEQTKALLNPRLEEALQVLRRAEIKNPSFEQITEQFRLMEEVKEVGREEGIPLEEKGKEKDE
jgi:hypothetical protein